MKDKMIKVFIYLLVFLRLLPSAAVLSWVMKQTIPLKIRLLDVAHVLSHPQ